MLAYILLGITGFFVSVLLVKNLNKSSFKGVCALCISISFTWLALLFLYKTNRFDNQLIIGILMGQSITGLFYLAKKRLPKEFRVFTLPFFISLTVAAFVILENLQDFLATFIILLAVWAVAFIVFVNRNDPGIKPLAENIMNCCDDD